METYLQSKLVLDDKLKESIKTDSLIDKRMNNYKQFLAEGSNTIYNKERKQIGDGGFSVYVFSEKSTNKIVKIEYSTTTHIDKSFKNSELLKIDIYFDENEVATFSKISEYHYTQHEVISSSEYYINLPKDDKRFDKIYHSNSSLKNRIKEINEIVKNYKNRK